MTSTTTDRHTTWQLQPLPGLEVLSPQARQLLAPPLPPMHWPFAAMGTLAREKPGGIPLPPSMMPDPLIAISQAREEHVRPPNLDRWLVDPLPTDFWANWLQRNGRLSEKPVCLYVAGCPPLGRLRDAFSASVFKVGTTSNMHRRLRALNSSQYASWTAHGERWTREDGFNQWSFEATRVDRPPSELSPVWVEAEHLGVRLPKDMSSKAFEEALNRALRSVAVDRWVRQKDVERSLMMQGLETTVGVRATAQVRRGTRNYRETSELVFFRRRFDWQALLAIVEDAIARYRV